MVEAIVEHDYNAKQQDELTIKKGDIIKEVVKKQDGWCEGVLDGKRGLFPDNFVVLLQVTMRTNGKKCRVVYSYKQEHEDELNLSLGDVIEVVGEEEEGWWRGKLHGKVGVFPSNFVEEVTIAKTTTTAGDNKDNTVVEEASNQTELLQQNQEKIPSKILCEVKYAYLAQNSDELSLKEGDLVTLISKDGQDAGWWRGELSGKVGVFPDNFVAIIESNKDKQGETSGGDKPTHTKVQHVAQRRSQQEVKGANAVAVAPPAVPIKKPTVPFKKSPSGAGGGLFSSLTKKIADTIDGSTSSKSIKLNSELPEGFKDGAESYHAFDQVERNSILPDVRANRVKAPGRRPPSVALKDGETVSSAVINGNSDYGSLEDNILSSSNTSIEQENVAVGAEIKPKSLECQKPPWLAEMKMNMKRSPGSGATAAVAASESTDVSPIDMSKSMPAMVLAPKKPPAEVRPPKTPPSELERGDNKEKVVMRTKPIVNVRPQSIEAPSPRPVAKTSPTIQSGKSVSPGPVIGAKPPIADRTSMEMLSSRHYNELSERFAHLEAEMARQRDEFRAAVDDLRGKLQVETDMRMLLQCELEKLQHQV